MTLYLAVTGGWGGGDCYRKADLFLEEVLKMYQPNPRAGLRPRAPEKDVRIFCGVWGWGWGDGGLWAPN